MLRQHPASREASCWSREDAPARQAPGRLRRRGEPARPPSTSCATLLAADAARVHGAGRLRAARRAAADRQRQGRPQRAAGAGSVARERPGRYVAPRNADRGDAGRDLGEVLRRRARSASTTTSSSSAATPSSASRSIARCRQAGLARSRRATSSSTRPSPRSPRSSRRGGRDARGARARRRRRPVPLTPIQRWFFEQRLANPHHWNQAFLFEVPADVDVDVARAGARPRRRHHDALRLRFTRDGAGAGSRTTARARRRRDRARSTCRRAPHERARRASRPRGRTAQASLDLDRGPAAARPCYFDLGDDGPAACCSSSTTWWSTASPGGSCSRTSRPAYRQLRAGAAGRAAAATTSFRRWAERCRHVRVDGASEAAAAGRWRTIDAVDGTLPTRRRRTGDEHRGARRATVDGVAGRDETRARCCRACRRPTAPRSTTCCSPRSAGARALDGPRRRSASTSRATAARTSFDDVDLSRTVGWFTTLFPCRLDSRATADAGSALKRVKEQLRQVPDRASATALLRYRRRSRRPRQLGRAAAARAALQLSRPVRPGRGGLGAVPVRRRADRAPGTAPANAHASPRGGGPRARRPTSRPAGSTAPSATGRRSSSASPTTSSTRCAALIEHCTSRGVRGYTPSDFPLARPRPGRARPARRAAPATSRTSIPLSPMQRLFLSMEAGGRPVGFEQWVFRLAGPLDSAALREAWEATVARHAILRTAFSTDGGRAAADGAAARSTLPWPEEDWTGGDAADAAATGSQSFLDSDRERGFDVGVAPLIRLTLVRLAMTSTGSSGARTTSTSTAGRGRSIFRDVGAAYAARLAGAAPSARPTPVSTAPTSAGWPTPRPIRAHFWKESSRDSRRRHRFRREPTPAADAEERDPRGRPRGWTPRPTAALQSLARAQRVTLNTVVQGAWASCSATSAAGTTWSSAQRSPAVRPSSRASRRWWGRA